MFLRHDLKLSRGVPIRSLVVVDGWHGCVLFGIVLATATAHNRHTLHRHSFLSKIEGSEEGCCHRRFVSHPVASFSCQISTLGGAGCCCLRQAEFLARVCATMALVQEAEDNSIIPAHPPSEASSADGIFCTMCKLVVKMMGRRPNLVETLCASNYKCLARRWKVDSRLRGWWAKQTPQEQTEWYRRNKAPIVAHGAAKGGRGADGKRPVEIGMTLEHSKQVGTSLKRRRMWVPYSAWADKQKMMSPGKEDATLRAEWKMLLLNPAVKKERFDDQWHIQEYQGIVDDTVENDFHAVRVERCASATSAPEAQEMLEQVRGAFDQARDRDRNLWAEGQQRVDPVVADLVPEALVEGRVALTFSDSCGVMEHFLAEVDAMEDVARQMETLMKQEFALVLQFAFVVVHRCSFFFVFTSRI